MKKSKSAPRDANLAPVSTKLVNIEQLSQLKGPSVRQLRTLVAKGILSRFKLGHRSQLFDPAQFDADIAAFEIKSLNRNGRPRLT